MKVKLTDICDIQYGYPFDSSLFSDTEGVPLVRIRDVVRGYSETRTTEKFPDEYIVNDGDILIGMDGDFNIAKWHGGFAALNQRVCRLIPRKVDQDYIFHFMPSALKQIEDKTPFVTVKHLSAKELNKIVLELPSTEEQTRIASVLNNISNVISYRQGQSLALDTLIKARFVEMFGDCQTNPKRWRTKALVDVAEVGSSKRVFVEELKESGIPFYRGTEIGTLAEGKSIQPELFITPEHYQELIEATGKPHPGDLLLPSICPDGRIWVVDTEEPFYFKDGRVLWVHRIKQEFDPVFLLYTLKDRIMTDYNSIASGTTFAELKIFSLKQCQVFDVPIEKQKVFAAFVRQTSKSKAAIQQALNESQLLFDSLMQKYFG